jgi:hypothetical protein
MPETNPLEPSGFDLMASLFPIVFAVVALGIVAVFATVVYRLVRDRKKIAAYREAMYELPGEILKATREGDLAKAQLLQSQLALMQQQQLLEQGRARAAGQAPLMNGAVGPTAGLGPSGVPGDINGDGVPGN